MLSVLLLEGRSISTYTFLDGMLLHKIPAANVYLRSSNYKGRGFGGMPCIDQDKLEFSCFPLLLDIQSWERVMLSWILMFIAFALYPN